MVKNTHKRQNFFPVAGYQNLKKKNHWVASVTDPEPRKCMKDCILRKKELFTEMITEENFLMITSGLFARGMTPKTQQTWTYIYKSNWCIYACTLCTSRVLWRSDAKSVDAGPKCRAIVMKFNVSFLDEASSGPQSWSMCSSISFVCVLDCMI